MSSLVIARRELLSLFLSPLAWVLLAITGFILAWIFLVQIDAFQLVQPRLKGLEGAPGLTQLVAAPTLRSAGGLVLLVLPLLTMRLLSGELRSGTFDLLQSSPVGTSGIVLGKFLGLMGFLAVLLALLAAMPLSLLAGGRLDLGQLAAGLLGLGLMLASFGAIGLFLSSLTAQPTVAAVLTYAALVFLGIVHLAAGAEGEGSELFRWISPQAHLEPLLGGNVRSGDLIFYLLAIATSLALAIRRLELRRTEG